MFYRGVFRTQSSICDGFFCENRKRVITNSCFRKKQQQKKSFIDMRLGSKYASVSLVLQFFKIHFTILPARREKMILFCITEKISFCINYCAIRNGSRNPSESKRKLFLTIVSGWKQGCSWIYLQFLLTYTINNTIKQSR